MKTGIKLLNSSGLLGGAEVVNNGCLFLRNLILARLLTKADFGIAATLGLVVALFELAGKMSFAQQCTQSPRGEDPHFQNVCHASQALAGLFSAALILAFVYPISTLFGMPEHRQAIALLAIVPLCTGFSNLDVYRLLRHLNFLPLVLTDAVPQVLLTMAAWPLASWLNDYRAILCILLGKAVLSLAASHLLAQRPYRLSWDAVFARENFRFGWPLLVMSFVMVGIFQGDRFLIASRY
jgi:O-antigen/teichoic acid export membrane protein